MAGRWHSLFAALGTDLGTNQRETHANKRDAPPPDGRLNDAVAMRPSALHETATGSRITQRSHVQILFPLPGKMAPGDVSGGRFCATCERICER